MAEIHPNDIGLATFADVGDVQNLRTTAKTIVEALNELYSSGGSGQGSLGTQWYVDGEDNIIIGENNVVYGNNNLIIGSNNVVVGDNHVLIKSFAKIYDISDNINIQEFYDNKIYYDIYSTEPIEIPFHVGDKIMISTSVDWVDYEWQDWWDVESETVITEITEVDEYGQYICVSEIPFDPNPPDDFHTNMDWPHIATFIPLNNDCKVHCNTPSGINLGSVAKGSDSFSANGGKAEGTNSFAANYATAQGPSVAVFNASAANKFYAFAANSGHAFGDYSAAFNYNNYAYNPYSFVTGANTRTCGRVLRCISLNNAAKSLTVESGQNLTGLEGRTVILRCYNNMNTIINKEVKVTSVSGNTLYFGEAYFNTNSYAEKLLPGNVAFVIDSSSSYGSDNFVGGANTVAAAKYSLAHGLYTLALHDTSVVFGKYGMSDSENGIFLANGTDTKNPGLAFKALSDGSVHADGEYTSPCADYAEFFEWKDGNPDNEDRAGYFVKLDGDKIVKCNAFDEPLGVVSAKPAIIGDSGEMHWQGKFVTDDFGRIQYHDVVVPAETDEEGNIIVEEHTECQPVINPDWDATKEYVPRSERSEWATVGVLGKLIVYDDGTLQAGDKCGCGYDGTAAKVTKNGYPVLKRVSEDKVLIWVK